MIFILMYQPKNTDTVTSYTTKFYWDEGIEVFPSTGHKAISHYFFDKISKYDYPPVKVRFFFKFYSLIHWNLLRIYHITS